MASTRQFIFAGGGTGGHIYPAIAVAQQLVQIEPKTSIHFFCSERAIDSQILQTTPFDFSVLPAQGLSLSPVKLIGFLRKFFNSAKTAKSHLKLHNQPVVVGAGGFVSSPVCWAAHKLNIPIALINVDIVPGKANKLNTRWAQDVFIHFQDTYNYFSRYKTKVHVTGCPLRKEFNNPHAEQARKQLNLDPDKNTLLITGASSGCKSINDTITALLPQLSMYKETWQIVHLTGTRNFAEIKQNSADSNLKYTVLPYYDNMADLLACADLLIGRSGAVSVAEYAVSGVPSICIPYPHHKDQHQYRNAGKLVEAGAAIMVDDLPDFTDRTQWLWEELEPLLKDDAMRKTMAKACSIAAKPNAGRKIAEYLLQKNY